MINWIRCVVWKPVPPGAVLERARYCWYLAWNNRSTTPDPIDPTHIHMSFVSFRQGPAIYNIVLPLDDSTKYAGT